MANVFSCIDINNLEEIAMIGGDQQTIIVQVLDETTGSPVDLSSATTSIVFSTYGQPDSVVLTKSGSVSGSYNNYFTSTLLLNDTKYLSGMYTYQPVVVDHTGQEFRTGQGLIMIAPRNSGS
jgi:hypothetical protein